MNKIPFDKKIADTTLKVCELFIELSKLNGQLTTEELIKLKDSLEEKYYNNKVELLEVE